MSQHDSNLSITTTKSITQQEQEQYEYLSCRFCSLQFYSIDELNEHITNCEIPKDLFKINFDTKHTEPLELNNCIYSVKSMVDTIEKPSDKHMELVHTLITESREENQSCPLVLYPENLSINDYLSIDISKINKDLSNNYYVRALDVELYKEIHKLIQTQPLLKSAIGELIKQHLRTNGFYVILNYYELVYCSKEIHRIDFILNLLLSETNSLVAFTNMHTFLKTIYLVLLKLTYYNLPIIQPYYDFDESNACETQYALYVQEIINKEVKDLLLKYKLDMVITYMRLTGTYNILVDVVNNMGGFK